MLFDHFNSKTYLDVVNEHFAKAVWQHVLGLLGRSITNVWHKNLALEAPSDSVVNTLRLSPAWLQIRETTGK